MRNQQLLISAEGPGLISCDALGTDGQWSRLMELFPEVRSGGSLIDWNWDEPSQSEQGIFLSAKARGLSLELSLRPEPDCIGLYFTIKADGPAVINSCLVHLDFLPGGKSVMRTDRLDDCHVPHLIPKPGMVISDMVFRSPALIVRQDSLALALLPNLDRLNKDRPAHWIMDFEREGPHTTPRLSLGIMHCKPAGHVYFMSEPDEQIEIPAEGLSFSGHILGRADAAADFTRSVLDFIWQRYGVPHYDSVLPQVLSYEELGQEAMDCIFKRTNLYFEFEYQGAKRAGLSTFGATTEKDLKPMPAWATGLTSKVYANFLSVTFEIMSRYGLPEKVDDLMLWSLHKLGLPYLAQAWFQSWFNNLRTAYGARLLADTLDDDVLRQRSELVKDLALSAPVDDGIFPSVCFFPEGRVWWKKGTLAFKVIDDYHTPDAATTGYMLLRWYRDIEQDPRLLEMAHGLARFFIKHQLPSGAVPTWIGGKSHKPMPTLIESASTAAPLMFMALLAIVDKNEAALESAKRMAEFLEREVIPGHLWYDYETFFSCTRKRLDFEDRRSTVPPQNGMSLCWASEGLRLMFEATRDEKYKGLMLAALDDLSFLQQAWDASVLSINTFGGFASINTDAEWNDAKQGLNAPVMMDSYLATGIPEYFQRGVAALRSCYATMLHPAFAEICPGNMIHYKEKYKGTIYENYSHSGRDNVIAGYQQPDWGAGTAAFATAHAGLFYGDIYINLDHGHAFGINGCVVKRFEVKGETVELDVESKVPDLSDWQVVIHGRGPGTKLILNGRDKDYR